jgi:hypothetical protein
MKYEYVVSGLTMGIDDLYYNEEVAKPYINHMNQKIIDLDKRFDNQNLSILYNAHQERRHGVTMTDTMSNSWNRIFADSGGLQMARTKKGITPELKDKVYYHQAKYCDVAMIFDEIPIEFDLSLIGGNSMKASLAGRRFDRSDIKRAAHDTLENVKRQIEVFKQEESKAKLMLISQGQSVDTYREYIEYICQGLDEEEINMFVCGVAPSSLCNGNSFAHRCEMIYAMKEYQIPDVIKENVHLLGVGNHEALSPFYLSPEYFSFIKNLSYDSSSHASSWFYSRYRNKDFVNIDVDVVHRSKKGLSQIHSDQLLPVINELFEYDRETLNDFGITEPMQLINDSTKWSVENVNGDRRFWKDHDSAIHGRYLTPWLWVTNTIGNFMIELDRRIKNPVDTTGLGSISSYDEFMTKWLSRQRAPEKVPEHWPGVLDV